jgi:hypothetical protein
MSEQSFELKTDKDIIDWCDKLHAEGKTLELLWEGGGDSGWVHMQIDGVEEDSDYSEKLISQMYDELDYGSWAGEFNAEGTATWDTNLKAFVGTDYYSETESFEHPYKIEIVIPEELWFDRFQYNVWDTSDENQDIAVEFQLDNGFLSAKHDVFLDRLKTSLIEKFISAFEDANSSDKDCDYISMSGSLNASDFEKRDDGHLVYTIDKVTVYYGECTEKSIVMSLSNSEE